MYCNISSIIFSFMHRQKSTSWDTSIIIVNTIAAVIISNAIEVLLPEYLNFGTINVNQTHTIAKW